MSDRSLLFDSHVWYWALLGDPAFGPTATRMIRSCARRQAIAVSEVSIWELAIKARKGKLDLRPDPSIWLERAAKAPGIGIVEINRQLLVRSALLEWSHGDPADRILVATALFYNLQFATADQVILDYARSNRALRVLDVTR